jgi:hypothetical protein
MRRKLISSVIAAAAIASGMGSAAAQSRLDAAYSVYLTGIPIGQGAIILDVNENGFAAAGSAKFTGLLRIVATGEGTSSVRGIIANQKVASTLYSMQSNYSNRAEKIEITVHNGNAQEFKVTPEKGEHSEGPRVAVTAAHRRNVVDPMSAGLILVPGTGDTLQPDSCNRTLPIFDARFRYDVVLSYLRTENAPKKINGYSGPVLVCQARYVPIAGHRTDRPQVQQMADNRDLFVWLAPIAGTRALIPIKVSISTMVGTMVVEATRFRVETGRVTQQTR